MIEKGFNQSRAGPRVPSPAPSASCSALSGYAWKAFALLDLHGKQELFSSNLPQFSYHMVQISKCCHQKTQNGSRLSTSCDSSHRSAQI